MRTAAHIPVTKNPIYTSGLLRPHPRSIIFRSDVVDKVVGRQSAIHRKIVDIPSRGQITPLSKIMG